MSLLMLLQPRAEQFGQERAEVAGPALFQHGDQDGGVEILPDQARDLFELRIAALPGRSTARAARADDGARPWRGGAPGLDALQ